MSIRTNPAGVGGTDLPRATQYAGLINANASLRAEIWSELVKRDARDKNIFKAFIGGEGSKKPVTEKRDLKAGGADKVTFTTVAPIRGQGRLGEDVLKGHTDNLNFGTFDVQVDLLRHAVSWTQVLQLLRFTGKTIDQLSAQLMSEWYGRKEQDDIQAVIRNTVLVSGSDTNYLRVGGHATDDEITLGDTLDTETVESGKQMLSGMGAEEIGMDTDVSGGEIPKFLFFGPDTLVRGLRQNSAFLQQLREAGVRGDGNETRTGKYPLWDNNIIFSHVIRIDTARGRQGSPLAPRAYLGAALTASYGAEKAITGGAGYNTDGSDEYSDYFANFRGYDWKITSGIANPLSETNPVHYVLIYNLSGADKGKYEVVQVDGNDGNQLEVTRAAPASGASSVGDVANTNYWIDQAGRFTGVHPSGSLVIPCNAFGVPLNYGIHFGANAVCYGKGSVDAEQIFHYDDFQNAGKRAHLNAVGIQGIRGFSMYQDTMGRYPNAVLVAGAATMPGLNFVDVAAVAEATS